MKETNKNYWYSKLINMTENFNIDNTKENVDIIESCYKNYLKYCDKNEKIILDNNYKPYITNYKKNIDEKTRKKKTITKIILGIITITLLGIITFLLTETPKKNTASIKLSDINEHYYVESNNYNYFKK